MEWFRWYHGAASDTKWSIIARLSKQNIGTVVSIWIALLEHASQADPRGSVADFDHETIDALYGYPEGTTVTTCNAMKRKGLFDDEMMIVSWAKRQPKREREDNSAERVRKHREKKKVNNPDQIDNCNAIETPSNANVTHETPRTEQNRAEQNREHTQETRVRDDADSSDSKPKFAPGPAPSEYSMEFLELAEQYPRKDEGLAAAWIAFKACKAAHAYPGNPIVLPILVQWRVSPQWTDDGGRFVPNFSRWIRERRWEAGPPEDEAAKVVRQMQDLKAMRGIKQ
jgi:hypothetical protein